MSNDNNDQKLTSFGFKDEKLKEEVSKSNFEIDGVPKFTFEDKKSYVVNVDTSKEIKSMETQFGLKYYIPIEVKGESFYWQASAKSLREVLDGVEEGATQFNVRGNFAEKTYSIIPMIDAK
jgi:hypothetical protein